MKRMTLFICLIITACAVGWGKPSEVRVSPLTKGEYVITVDGDPWLTTTGKMVEQFHQKARSVCGGDYEVVSIKEQQGYGGLTSFSLSNVTGLSDVNERR